MTTMCPLNTVMLLNIKMHQTMCTMVLQRAKLLKIKRNQTMCPMMMIPAGSLSMQTQCESQKEKLKFDRMLEDHKKGLYPNCEDGNTKLGTVLELLQWKAENAVPDKGFEKLLKILKKKLPKDNELPDSTYTTRKVVCPLGLEVQKIHACPNDCILYRGAYKDLNACPVCGALRYKIRRDDPGDVDGEPPRKRVPAKVMWYAPIIPRLKRLFQNKEHAMAQRRP